MQYFNLSNVFQVAKLTNDDAIAINNLRVLGGEPDAKKTSTSGFGLKFDMHKVEVIYSLILNHMNVQCQRYMWKVFLINYQKKRAVRKNRAEEETWQLSRFYPIIEVQIKLTQFSHIKYVLILWKGDGKG